MRMDQYIGRLLDNRYEILEIIGTGGMAVVYKARCHRLNRLVAVKILKDEFSGDEEFRRRFRAEGEAVAMLSHPNIVQVYDVSTSDNANFMVMELIDGISLKQYMEKKGVLNWKETLHFSMQIAKGLEHAHGRGIVHRDIKPHNVMVLKNGSVKVMDFGIARVMNKSNTLTKEALGSVHYISPEQAKGGHTDNRSDLYSLSVVMYEMMAGRPPYDGESAVAVAIQHINGGAPLPTSYNPNIPGGLEQIIMKGMSLEIKDRYVSATEMLQDMEEFRKNPAIQFSYHSVLDGATRAIPTAVMPRTVAEKKVQAHTGGKRQSQSAVMRQSQSAVMRQSQSAVMRQSQSAVMRQQQTPSAVARRSGGALPMKMPERQMDTISRAQQRRREEEKRKEEARSRAATTAIVFCSGVAVIAIIVFLVALFNGALLNREKDLVEVPYLEGKMYSEYFNEEYKDFNIRLQPQQYSDAYKEGQIMHQEPAGGSQVQKKTDLWLTVSMGKEPETKLMENFLGFTWEQVEALLEGQGYEVLVRNESSYVYEEGEIIRTEPVDGTALTPGQTIKLWVSTGPAVVEQKMPNVVGMDVERAKEWLGQLGFTNVHTVVVRSDEPAGEVISQSVVKNKLVDVTTEILLQVSEGPDETESSGESGKKPVPEETQEPMTASYAFALPQRDDVFILSIYQVDGDERIGIIEAQEIAPGTASFFVNLTGTGTQIYEVYIDGELYRTQEMVFTE